VLVGDRSVMVSEDNGITWEYRFDETGTNVNGWLTDVYVLDNKTAITSTDNGTFYKIDLGEKNQ
jgi:photosystem II stability/assembly factor-like uncharacterized protein